MVKLQKSEKGFSIIEVLIVLAIAGLIMVVVFLAVPALQRNARNNALSTNANNVYSGLSNFISNNNGQPPTSFSLSNNQVTITRSTGSPNPEVVDVDSSIASIAAYNSAAPTSVGQVFVVVGTAAKCNDTKSGLQSNPTGTSSRSIAILYGAESNAGSIAVRCQD